MILRMIPLLVKWLRSKAHEEGFDCVQTWVEGNDVVILLRGNGNSKLDELFAGLKSLFPDAIITESEGRQIFTLFLGEKNGRKQED